MLDSSRIRMGENIGVAASSEQKFEVGVSSE